MTQHTFCLEQNTFRFRRFSRAAYAAFASMHKQVTIGTLAGVTADAQMRKDAAEELRLSQTGDANRIGCNDGENDDVAVGSLSVVNTQSEAFAIAVVAFSTVAVAACATYSSLCLKHIFKDVQDKL